MLSRFVGICRTLLNRFHRTTALSGWCYQFPLCIKKKKVIIKNILTYECEHNMYNAIFNNNSFGENSTFILYNIHRENMSFSRRPYSHIFCQS